MQGCVMGCAVDARFSAKYFHPALTLWWLPMLWRAINLSLLLGGIVYLPTLILHFVDFWFFPPGEGFLNSDVRAMPESEVLSEFLVTLMSAPLRHLAVSMFIFALQLPFLI